MVTSLLLTAPSSQVTVSNHVFHKLMHQYTPTKLAAILVRPAFDKIHFYMTQLFVETMKRHMTETALKSVLEFRKSTALAGVSTPPSTLHKDGSP